MTDNPLRNLNTPQEANEFAVALSKEIKEKIDTECAKLNVAQGILIAHRVVAHLYQSHFSMAYCDAVRMIQKKEAELSNDPRS